MDSLIPLLTTANIGGFGSNTSTGFGAQKTGAFGAPATTGGGLFGSGTATAGTTTGFGGGFGASNTTSSPFGANNTSGGLFGANKPAFGSSTTTNTSNPFGGGTSTGFGSGSTSAFGAPASTALGGAVGEAPGTASVQFAPFVEKEPGSTSNQQNSFQNICFQPAYQKWSPEELRLADYAQGRRYGTTGGFGNTSFGGGFGSTNTNTSTGFGSGSTAPGTGGLFGGTSTSSPFGQSQPQQQTNAFGASNSGSLFGQKPATGGLFGSTNTTQSPFGASNTSTAFGAGANTGSNLFGNNNNTANKPFSFGTSQAPTSSGGFGTAGNTTAFGSGGLFGGSTQQNTASPFGGAQQQQATANPFGGFSNNANQQQQQQTGTSLFGNANQQKPAGGLFGAAAPATGGLFGNTSQPAATGGLFGSSQPAGNTGGLFGNTANTQGSSLFGGNKTATPSTGGLFGNTGQNANTGGLFGNLNNNQNQTQQNTGSLFGGATNQAQKPSLFGSQPSGTGLFGNSGNQSGGLFGGQQQQPQNSVLGGSSLFGGSTQPQQQTPQSLTASINDNAAYGTASLFSNLAATQVNNPGPLATPLSSSVKQKKTPVLPMYRLNPASSSRLSTPQKRGFGFSYTTYGTPGSASSTASTPGNFNNSLFSGSLGRSLGKSVSTSNLRRSLSTEDSILAPGAFSATSGGRNYGSTGSMKKLVINRGIRSDLFTPPTPPQHSQQTGILKKRVSFESSSMSGSASGVQNGTSNALKPVQNHAEPSSEELGYLRPRSSTNSSDTNGASSPPEMEQVKGNELAIVVEEDQSTPVATNGLKNSISREDPEPGQYWMKPTKEEIQGMNRVQRQKVTGFTVGRDGVGEVTFNVPVDLTNINLDEIFDDLVVLLPRSCTVYPNPSKKPPVGKGLNVPSTISLKNSWPRGKDKRTPTGEKTGPRVQKHVERLKRVADTQFVNYDAETGVWTFMVEHFTTYGLDYDEDEDAEGEASEFGQSTMSVLPGTPTPRGRTPRSEQLDDSFASTSQLSRTESDPEDTFDFKRRKVLPGAFDNSGYVEDEGMEDEPEEPSFLDDRSVGSLSDNAAEEPMDQDDVFVDDESVSIVDQDMAGAYPDADNTAEHTEASQDEDELDMDETPGGIMRARMIANKALGSPEKRKFKAGDDWTAALKTTISPQKQDRAQLKTIMEIQESQLRLAAPSPVRGRIVSDGRGFATSIDLMNSLFGQTKSPAKAQKVPAKSQGFEVGVPSFA